MLRQEATRALVTQVVPVQVDLPQLGPIDARTARASSPRTRQLAIRTRTGWAETRDAQDGRQTFLWVEWNAAILRILRMTTGNGDLVSLPIAVPMLNPQHLAPATARLQGAEMRRASRDRRTCVPVRSSARML